MYVCMSWAPTSLHSSVRCNALQCLCSTASILGFHLLYEPDNLYPFFVSAYKIEWLKDGCLVSPPLSFSLDGCATLIDEGGLKRALRRLEWAESRTGHDRQWYSRRCALIDLKCQLWVVWVVRVASYRDVTDTPCSNTTCSLAIILHSSQGLI